MKTADELAMVIANECLAGRVRRLNRVITGLYDRALAPYGIKVTQVGILVVLLRRGEVSPAEIGAQLQMEKSTVSRNLVRMEKNGWVEVATKSEGVGLVVKITPAGNQLFIDAHDCWVDAQSKALELVGEEGTSALRLLAERVRPKS